jgi:lysophospholipase L1-like esterase
MTQQPPDKKAPRRWLRWLRRGLIALLVLLFGAEVAVRVAGVGARMPTFCTWNPRMGCVTNPNIHESMAMGDRHFEFATNALGLRNPPLTPKAPGQKRVLVLGDSVVFAPQVSDDSPFPNLLDASLKAEHIEVVNAGSNYLRAPDQQLSWFLDVRATLQPDLVIAEFTERNDFSDIQHEYWWHAGKKGLERQTAVKPLPHDARVLASNDWAVVHFLDEHSRLFGLFRGMHWNIMHLPRIDSAKRWREATEEVLVRLKQEVEARGGRFALVIYPSPELLTAMRGEGKLRPDNHDHALILAIATEQKMAFLDLTPLLAPKTARDLLDDDGHLTLAGHKAVAVVLAPQIREWLK